jgi:hypothetical protein
MKNDILIKTIHNLLINEHNRGYLYVHDEREKKFIEAVLGSSMDLLSDDCEEKWASEKFPKNMVFYDTSVIPIQFAIAVYSGNPDFSYFINLQPYFKKVVQQNLKYIL